jgi:TRAP-type C4-dicarboxylate transport system permease small subunit
MTINKLFEAAAAVALCAMLLIAIFVAIARYVFSFVPVWSAPVMTSLVVFSVALAVGPGLHEGIHIAIHLGTDRLSEGGRAVMKRVVSVLTFVLGVAFLVSGVAYASELWMLGVSDFAGIPQWIPAAIAAIFGATLVLFSLRDLRR